MPAKSVLVLKQSDMVTFHYTPNAIFYLSGRRFVIIEAPFTKIPSSFFAFFCILQIYVSLQPYHTMFYFLAPRNNCKWNIELGWEIHLYNKFIAVSQQAYKHSNFISFLNYKHGPEKKTSDSALLRVLSIFSRVHKEKVLTCMNIGLWVCKISNKNIGN